MATERIDKLILETEYKVSGVEVSTQKLTELQKATDAITTANLEKVAADKKVEQAANQLNKTIETETKVQTDLAKSIKETGKAMNAIAQNNAMKEAFKDVGVKDLDTQLKQFIQTARGAKSIEELSAAMDEFVASLPEEIQGDVFKLLQKETKKLEATLINPVARLRELKRLINTETDPQLLIEYQKEAASLQKELSDTNKLVKQLGSNTFFADTVVEGAQQAVGAFTAFQGVLALTTDDQEKFAQAAAKAQGALALLQGTQQIITNLKKSDNIVTRAQIIGQQLYARVVGTSTGAMKGFRLALAATGIGFAVIAIGKLVENWDKLKAAISGSSKEFERNARIQKEAIANSAEEISQVEILRSKINDESISRDERARLISEAQEKYPGLLKNIDAEKVGYEAINKALDGVNEAIQKRATLEVLNKELQELIQKQRELQKAGAFKVLEEELGSFQGLFTTIVKGFASGKTVTESLADEVIGAPEEAKKQGEEVKSEITKVIEEFKAIEAELQGAFAEDTRGGNSPSEKLLQGSIAALEAEISRLTNVRDKLTIAGSEESLAAQAEIDQRKKELEELKRLYGEEPVDVQLFAEGSLKALQKQVNELNDIVESLSPSAERDEAVKKLQEAQAALTAERERVFGKEVEQAKEQNGVLFEEEERHQLAMQQIEGDSSQNQLKTQLSYAKDRLAALQESGTATEEELEKQANVVTELEAKLNAEIAEQQKQQKAQRIAAIKETVDEAVRLVDTLLSIEIDKYSKLADLQQERVNQALAIADKGNAELLQLEEKRLADLNSKREAFVRKQQALAQIQLISESMLAIAKAAAEGGALAPFTIAATLLALASGLAQARAAAQQQSFRKGGIFEGGYTGDGPEGGVSRQLGSKPYEYHYKEHIMPAPVVKIGNNAKWLEKIRMERIDIGRLLTEKRSKQVVVAPSEAPIVNVNNTFKLNSRGIVSIVEQREKDIKRINSKR